MMTFDIKQQILNYEKRNGGNLTYDELAGAVGCSKTTIYHLANNIRRRIDLDLLERLCRFFDVTPNDLIVPEGE
jgi:DNA-binding Xre family transcriptional regulator